MMSAIRFLKETQRMCNSYQECTDCPLKELASFSGRPTCKSAVLNECEKAIFAVDVWSKEHPIITNAMKFKEVFGFNGDTVNKVKPEKGIAGTKGSCGYDDCRDSCGSRCFPRCPMWWDDEYKEPEHED